MKDIKHIFFDLDHTLWDFDTNSKATLTDLYHKHHLYELLKCNVNEFITVYMKINNDFWRLCDEGKVSKSDFRVLRFIQTFEKFGYKNDELAILIDEEYITTCPRKGGLLDGALDVLKYLNANYVLHIITNGFKEIQLIKLSAANLSNYFRTITTAECASYHKPAPQIFEMALQRANATIAESIYIGDNPFSDIMGGKKYGLKTIWYNSRNLAQEEEPDFHINTLRDLFTLF